jgi:hypothetical protein
MKPAFFDVAYKNALLLLSASMLLGGCATHKADQTYRDSNLSKKPFGANVSRVSSDGSLVELEVRNNTERRIDFVTFYFYPYNEDIRVGEGLTNIISFNPGETLVQTVPVLTSGRKWNKWKVEPRIIK